MQDPTTQLTLDDAVAQFLAMIRQMLDDAPRLTHPRGETPEEAEARRFHLAELLLTLSCPDPRACTNQRCRRDVMCRHFARLQAKRASGTSVHPLRTPGAEAARYAIWVYMSSAQPGS